MDSVSTFLLISFMTYMSSGKEEIVFVMFSSMSETRLKNRTGQNTVSCGILLIISDVLDSTPFAMIFTSRTHGSNFSFSLLLPFYVVYAEDTMINFMKGICF